MHLYLQNWSNFNQPTLNSTKSSARICKNGYNYLWLRRFPWRPYRALLADQTPPPARRPLTGSHCRPLTGSHCRKMWTQLHNLGYSNGTQLPCAAPAERRRPRRSSAPVMEYRVGLWGGLGWPGLVERGRGLCEIGCAASLRSSFAELIYLHSTAIKNEKKKICSPDCDGPVTIRHSGSPIVTDSGGSVTNCTKSANCDGISVTIVEYSVTNFNYFRRHCSSVTNKISPSQFPSQIVTDINSVTIFRHNFATFL